MEIGRKQRLKVADKSASGFLLEDKSGVSIFLSKILGDDSWSVGDEVEVFVYQDNEKLQATLETPFCEVGEFAVMTCVQSLPSGAFMDWGIIKDLFIPYTQQRTKIIEGKKYLVYVYLDETSQKITGTTKYPKKLQYSNISLKKGDVVSLIMAHETELGWNVVVNQKYWGLVYQSDIYQKIYPLSEERGYVKNIREDGKIDITLQPEGYENIEVYQQRILDKLEKQYGLLYLSDQSSSEEIKAELQMSRKNFKKAIGGLYKTKKIEIMEDRIKLK